MSAQRIFTKNSIGWMEFVSRLIAGLLSVLGLSLVIASPQRFAIPLTASSQVGLGAEPQVALRIRLLLFSAAILSLLIGLALWGIGHGTRRRLASRVALGETPRSWDLVLALGSAFSISCLIGFKLPEGIFWAVEDQVAASHVMLAGLLITSTGRALLSVAIFACSWAIAYSVTLLRRMRQRARGQARFGR